jgi:prophage regulatory protein
MQEKRIIRKKELRKIIGLSDPSIYRLEKDGQFPRRLQLGGNSVGWLSTEVQEWIENKAAERD